MLPKIQKNLLYQEKENAYHSSRSKCLGNSRKDIASGHRLTLTVVKRKNFTKLSSVKTQYQVSHEPLGISTFATQTYVSHVDFLLFSKSSVHESVGMSSGSYFPPAVKAVKTPKKNRGVLEYQVFLRLRIEQHK